VVPREAPDIVLGRLRDFHQFPPEPGIKAPAKLEAGEEAQKAPEAAAAPVAPKAAPVASKPIAVATKASAAKKPAPKPVKRSPRRGR
jgi:hypothetical protein